MGTNPSASRWALEVVRGRDPGRRYPLDGVSFVLGNAPNGTPGIDLSDQEGSSPRKMAGRQVQLDLGVGGIVLRDLDSPGGTFVNLQRVLAGQARPLQAGDVIQLGGVQLRVVRTDVNAPARSATPAQPPAALEIKIGSGTTCRSWDDVLRVSTQRWSELREELVSGRLAATLARIGRSALAPDPDARGMPDERLDAWLSGLPTTRPFLPELDVHPARIEIQSGPGGGTLRRTLQILNIGHRLLRVSARLESSEPPGWLEIDPAWARGPTAVVDQAELPLVVRVPEALDRPLRATIVLEGNGGSKRVEVTLERAASSPAEPVLEAGTPPFAPGSLAGRLGRVPSSTLVPIMAGLGGLTRLVLALADRAVASPAGEAPGLLGPALVLAVLGGLGGFWFSRRQQPPGDSLAMVGAGGMLGLLAAAVLTAACRAIEPLGGAVLGRSMLVAILLWVVLGAGLGMVLSALGRPGKSHTEVGT
jgi:hypothetical protein